MADTTTIARITGTALTPGVSRNGRLYSPEVIAKAARRMRERIADPDALPIVMRSHHNAEDDSLRIVARVRSASVGEDGCLKYTADLYDTAAGRDIAGLVTGNSPALRSTSIYGYWLGPVRRTDHQGRSVESADDLEIDFIDFTASPGVPGALVDLGENNAAGRATESAHGRTPVAESFESLVEPVTEPAPPPEITEAYTAKQKKAALAAGQAMRNADGEPAYTIKNKSDLRKAIKAVGRGGADHDAIRKHIMTRAAALGLTAMIPDTWNKDGSMKETSSRFGEIREYYPDGPDGQAGFCIDAYNGPVSLTLRACGLDPGELRVIAAAAMTAACDALAAMDPDMDGDIDVDGAPNADSDGDAGTGESATGANPVAENAAADATDPEPAAEPDAPARAAETEQPTQTPAEPAAESTETEPAMGETTPAAETTAPTRTLSDEDIAALGRCFREALTADRAETAENAAAKAAKKAAKEARRAARNATAETTSETAKESAETPKAPDLAALKESLLAEVREELRKQGAAQRKGLTVGESDKAPDDIADLWDNRAALTLGAIGIGANAAA